MARARRGWLKYTMENELKVWIKRLSALRDAVCDAEAGDNVISGDSLMQLRSRGLRVIRNLRDLCDERDEQDQNAERTTEAIKLDQSIRKAVVEITAVVGEVEKIHRKDMTKNKRKFGVENTWGTFLIEIFIVIF